MSYAYDSVEEHSFLAQDLSVRCDGSDEHSSILAVAWGLVIIWPIGMVVLYIALLIPCRFMLLDENQEYHRLLDATAFLHRDYKPGFYFWEVVSLMQRNTLNGWLLLIDIDLQFIRLLTALVISILFLVWGRREHHASARP
jgi:hypothetical protein